MNTTYFLYILYSASADRYYVGYTTDYLKRLEDHNHQEFFNTYTSKFRPWSLAAVFQIGGNESEAVRLERFIKKQKNRRLLEQLVDRDFIPTGVLAQLVIPHLRDARAGLIRGSLVQSLSRSFGIQEEELSKLPLTMKFVIGFSFCWRFPVCVTMAACIDIGRG